MKKEEIINFLHAHDIYIAGVASVDRWNDFNEVELPYRPQSLWREAKSVIVFGVPVFLPTLETTPSINYAELYTTTNQLLDQSAYRLANYMLHAGYPAIYMPRDGYGDIDILIKKPVAGFSQVFAAKYAGLGTIGFNHTLLHPQYGPRVRYVSVFTSLELEPDPVIETDLCIHCRICEKCCPSKAFSLEPGKKIASMDKKACAVYHRELRQEHRYPCGVCIKVCPVGTDRDLYNSKDRALYIKERDILEDDENAPEYASWVHLRQHGSKGDRIF